MLHWWYQERSQYPHYGVFRVPGRWPLLLCTYRTDPHRESRTNRGKISIFRSNAKNTILPRFYFSAIRNCITLKQRWRGLRPLCRFTTIRNYITLKLGYTTTFNSSGRGLIFLLFLSLTLFLISFSFYHSLYSEASCRKKILIFLRSAKRRFSLSAEICFSAGNFPLR